MPSSLYGPVRRALVLAGGGITGGLYEVGALMALDALFENTSVREFDLYVGTSAGAFVAALVANNVAPSRIRDTLEHDRRTLPLLTGSQFLSVPWRSHLATLPRLATAIPGVVQHLWTNWRDALGLDTLGPPLNHLPAGLSTPPALETPAPRGPPPRGRGTEVFRGPPPPRPRGGFEAPPLGAPGAGGGAARAAPRRRAAVRRSAHDLLAPPRGHPARLSHDHQDGARRVRSAHRPLRPPR